MILDQYSNLSELVAKDLYNGKNPDVGRACMTGEQALRAALLYRRMGLPYRELAFLLIVFRGTGTPEERVWACRGGKNCAPKGNPRRKSPNRIFETAVDDLRKET